jgi:hypothetical protein
VIDVAHMVMDSATRTPDFRDTTTDTVVWIGPDAAVEVKAEVVPLLSSIADFAGQHARSGRLPSEFGIEVVPFVEDYEHVTFAPASDTHRRTLSDDKRRITSLWLALRDALGWEHEEPVGPWAPAYVAAQFDLDVPAKRRRVTRTPQLTHA